MNPGFAPAKVNLFLHVTGRRPDGYHLLDSIAVFPLVGDLVTAAPAPTLSLQITGPFADALSTDSDNLVLRAARTLATSAGISTGAALTLEKHLPIASGIGGGSSDAAAALRVLSALWTIHASLDELALRLGADVPVCLARRPMRMAGIGELLRPGPALPPIGMVLVNPGIAVSTPAVFRARTGPFSPEAILPPSWPNAAAMAADLSRLANDLEAPAVALAPSIGETLAALRADSACLLARMSGSGATCFGLFETPSAAIAAAEALRRPGWWVWAGGLAEPTATGI